MSQVMLMERTTEQLCSLFSEPLASAAAEALERGNVEEIRLRAGSAASYLFEGREILLSRGNTAVVCQPQELTQVIRRASDHAIYAVQDQLAGGFLTLPGGHRIGVCGRVVMEGDSVRGITEFQSLNLRIAREIPGAADGAANLLWSNPASTLILGPPGRGKTTVLRDLIRQLSDRFRYRISVVDERGEIAACAAGLPQLRVGRRTDVLSLCPKRLGIDLVLRSMGPGWIALDEITTAADVEAVIQASYSGVRFLATAHAWSREDLHRRPLYRTLMEAGVFENLVGIEADRRLKCERIGVNA